jgi:hypothetical protein
MIKVGSKVVDGADGSFSLVFTFDDESLSVLLTSKESSQDLKTVYEKLLALLLADGVSVSLDEESSAPGMFLDVSKEYVKSLNNDLVTVRQEIVSKGLGIEGRG